MHSISVNVNYRPPLGRTLFNVYAMMSCFQPVYLCGSLMVAVKRPGIRNPTTMKPANSPQICTSIYSQDGVVNPCWKVLV